MDNKAIENGAKQAFPVFCNLVWEDGLTKREEFAKAALEGLANNFDLTPAEKAREARILADLLLEELSK